MTRIWLCFAVLSTLTAQSEFRADGRLVLVNAGVYDDDNRFRPGLGIANFQLSDEGKVVPLHSVVVEEVAISTVILLDVSRSMAANLGDAREALGRFLDRARTGDEFCLLVFRDQTPGGCEFQRDPGVIRRQAGEMEAGGGTALNDAILQALALTRRAHNARRAVLILSDGLDNSSDRGWNDVRRQALETDAVLYGVTLPAWRGRDVWKTVRLGQLAEETGGRMLTAETTRELPAALDRLEVRLQYLLAFVPPAPVPARPWRSVRVKLQGPAARNLRVYWRHQYSALAR